MSEPTDVAFYAEWPNLGKGLGHQLEPSRINSSVGKVWANSSVFDNTDPIKESVSLGWEFGDLTQHNRFRAVYNKDTTQWEVQVNTGTEESPTWVTSISVDGTGVTSFYPFFGLDVVEDSNVFYFICKLLVFSVLLFFTSYIIGNPVVNSRVAGGGGGAGTITGGTALGGDEDIFAGEVANDLTFKGLTAGTNINLSSDANQVTVDIEDNPAFKNATVTGGFYTENITAADGGTFGPVGSEGAGIKIAGLDFDSSLKASDINGTRAAMFILHRHSTSESFLPAIVSTRSNSDDASHSPVTTGQHLLSIFGAGWTGSTYDVGGRIDIQADDGTIGSGSMPGRIVFRTNPDGANTLTPPAVAVMNSDKSVDFMGDVNVAGNAEISGDFYSISACVGDGTLSTLPSPRSPNGIGLKVKNDAYVEGNAWVNNNFYIGRSNARPGTYHQKAGSFLIEGAGSGAESQTPISGSGIRYMWIPQRRAIRAGELTTGTDTFGFENSEKWDHDNIGTYSVAIGLNPLASGLGSVALGDTATSTSDRGFAIGLEANCSGTNALALGSSSDASATDSIAVGNTADAQAVNAIALGNAPIASGVDSVAIGLESTSQGTESFAAGSRADAAGNFSVAIGKDSQASISAIALGRRCESNGLQAASFGFYCVSSGTAAVSIGKGCEAISGGISIGEGASATAKSICIAPRITFGGTNITSRALGTEGSPALALGGYSEATGSNSISIGANQVGGGTGATGAGAIAIGRFVSNAGTSATALGDSSSIGASASFGLAFSGSVTAADGIAIGRNSTSTALRAVAVGGGSVAEGASSTGINSVAIGISSDAQGTDSLAAGSSATATGDRSLALGDSADVSGDDSFCIGNPAATIDSDDSVAICTTPNTVEVNSGTVTALVPGRNQVAIGSEVRCSPNNEDGFNIFALGSLIDAYGSSGDVAAGNVFFMGSGAIISAANEPMISDWWANNTLGSGSVGGIAGGVHLGISSNTPTLSITGPNNRGLVDIFTTGMDDWPYGDTGNVAIGGGFHSNLDVKAKTHINQRLDSELGFYVEGGTGSLFSGDLILERSDLTINDGGATIDNRVNFGDTLHVTDDAFFGSDVSVDDNFYVGNDAVVTNDLTVGGELLGSRHLLTFGLSGTIASASGGNTSDDLHVAGGVDPRANDGGSLTHGMRMIRSGSIVGVSVQFDVDAFVTSDDTIARTIIGSSTALQHRITVSGNGRTGGQVTESRGTHTFAAGDVLNFRLINESPGDYQTIDPIGLIEIVYDT